jgi:two-component system response regulator YesN
MRVPMIKIIVVDDDKIIRKGIIKIIQKDAEQFQIVGEAANGERALELIKDLKPDVLITDIKMPVMDGVQLIDEIKKANIEISIIVLSGFDDYRYVRETLKNGAYDYILKPIDNSVMHETLNKIKENIMRRKKEQSEISHFTELVSESEKIIKEKVLAKLLNEIDTSAEEINKLNYLEANEREKFSIIVLSIDGLYKYEGLPRNGSNLLLDYKQKLYSILSDINYETVVVEKDNKLVLLFKCSESCDIKLLAENFKKIQNENGGTFTIGIANLFCNYNSITQHIKKQSVRLSADFTKDETKYTVMTQIV